MSKLKRFELFPKRFGWYPAVWLIYLSMPLTYALQSSGWRMAAGLLLIMVFIAVYRQLYFVEGRRYRNWLWAQMSVILAIALVVHPSCIFLGLYVPHNMATAGNDRQFHWMWGGFLLMTMLPLAVYRERVSDTDMLFFTPFLALMWISPWAFRSLNKRRELRKELDQANEQIGELVKREERMRIARDLHDTMGHALSLIALKSQLVEKLVMVDPVRAQAEAREIRDASRAALVQVRELVSEMRSWRIDEALAEVRQILGSAEILVTVEEEGLEAGIGGPSGEPADDAVWGGLTDLRQNIVSMCLLEAATNVVKHSKARHCAILIRREPGGLAVRISDDGIGRAGDCPEGNGLKGMAERLGFIEGTMELLQSAAGGGTVLALWVPLPVTGQGRTQE